MGLGPQVVAFLERTANKIFDEVLVPGINQFLAKGFPCPLLQFKLPSGKTLEIGFENINLDLGGSVGANAATLQLDVTTRYGAHDTGPSAAHIPVAVSPFSQTAVAFGETLVI